MRFRELLQTEIWNKRISWKILVGFGVALGIVLAGFIYWRVVDQNRITPGERSDARAALVQLDALQDAGFLRTEIFALRAKETGRMVDDARQAARTARDRKIVAELVSYQSTIVANHAYEEKQALAQQQNSNRKPNEWTKSLGFGIVGIDFDSRELHKELD